VGGFIHANSRACLAIMYQSIVALGQLQLQLSSAKIGGTTVALRRSYRPHLRRPNDWDSGRVKSDAIKGSANRRFRRYYDVHGRR
jgi:hypothetical protein